MPMREKKEGRLDYKTSSKESLTKLVRKLQIKYIYQKCPMNLRVSPFVLLPCSILD